MKVDETNWAWFNGKSAYFKINTKQALNLGNSKVYPTELKFSETSFMGSTFFIIPKEFITNG